MIIKLLLMGACCDAANFNSICLVRYFILYPIILFYIIIFIYLLYSSLGYILLLMYYISIYLFITIYFIFCYYQIINFLILSSMREQQFLSFSVRNAPCWKHVLAY